ncbi:MAG: hypothetical protein MHPSP_001540, partial [Paramarteilia canceri]
TNSNADLKALIYQQSTENRNNNNKNNIAGSSSKSTSLSGCGNLSSEYESVAETETWLEACSEWKEMLENAGIIGSYFKHRRAPEKVIALLRGESFPNRIGIPHPLRIMIWQILCQYSESMNNSHLLENNNLSAQYA